MNVSDAMTTNVVSISMDEAVSDVQRMFDDRGFHHLVVVENGQVVGVVSDRDLLRNLSPFVGSMSERSQDTNLGKRRVHQIMTRRLVSVLPETLLADAAQIMLTERVSCLPVVDGRLRCVGILSWRDLLIWSLRCMQDQIDEGESAAA